MAQQLYGLSYGGNSLAYRPRITMVSTPPSPGRVDWLLDMAARCEDVGNHRGAATFFDLALKE